MSLPRITGVPQGCIDRLSQMQEGVVTGTVGIVSPNALYLELLGVFEFTYAERRISLPSGAQRLLALLALNSDGVYRAAAAETLWPDCTPARAAANLRTALCQARRTCAATTVESVGQRLRLAPSVTVDLNLAWTKARQVISGLGQLPLDCETYIGDLTQQLLPGWPEEWLIPERDRWGQMRQHALEHLALQFRAAGQYLPAIQSALAAIAVDPIRENAHRILIEVHADEGNVACALMRYRHYETLLRQELGVAPSGQMTQLIQNMIGGPRQWASIPPGAPSGETAPRPRNLERDVQHAAGSRKSWHVQRAHHLPDGPRQHGQSPR